MYCLLFPSHDHSPGSLPWWLHPGLVQGTSGNLCPLGFVCLAALRGCCGSYWPLEDTVAPGLHVVPSQSCNSKASQKAKPSLCIKAPTVCLLYGGERWNRSHTKFCATTASQGRFFVLSFKNQYRGPPPTVGNHVSPLLQTANLVIFVLDFFFFQPQLHYMGLLECECIQERCKSVFISELIYSFIQHWIYRGKGRGTDIYPKLFSARHRPILSPTS